MARYAEASEALVCEAASRVLEDTGLAVDRITHVIWVTCTGFAAPGPALSVGRRLGLRADVHHLQVGFMGCSAAVHGLRAADAYCAAEPDAVVLVVCVELCTLHFNALDPSPEQLIINSHFSDGAAVALVSRSSVASEPLLQLGRFLSRQLPPDPALLSWRLGNGGGFLMGLGRNLPQTVARHVTDLVAGLPLAAPAHEVGWIVHPGGKAIVEAVVERLSLDPSQVAPSLQTLRDYGNMSSPTVLFALKAAQPLPSSGRLLAFGPGPSLEGLTWTSGR